MGDFTWGQVEFMWVKRTKKRIKIFKKFIFFVVLFLDVENCAIFPWVVKNKIRTLFLRYIFTEGQIAMYSQVWSAYYWVHTLGQPV